MKLEVYNNNDENKNTLDSMDKNEIKMIIKINENDINKEIYFLDNIDDINDEIKIKPEHNQLNEMNESNTDLYINYTKYKFQKYFIFE